MAYIITRTSAVAHSTKNIKVDISGEIIRITVEDQNGNMVALGLTPEITEHVVAELLKARMGEELKGLKKVVLVRAQSKGDFGETG